VPRCPCFEAGINPHHNLYGQRVIDARARISLSWQLQSALPSSAVVLPRKYLRKPARHYPSATRCLNRQKGVSLRAPQSIGGLRRCPGLFMLLASPCRRRRDTRGTPGVAIFSLVIHKFCSSRFGTRFFLNQPRPICGVAHRTATLELHGPKSSANFGYLKDLICPRAVAGFSRQEVTDWALSSTLRQEKGMSQRLGKRNLRA